MLPFEHTVYPKNRVAYSCTGVSKLAEFAGFAGEHRGRDGGCPPPPAQIPASGTPHRAPPLGHDAELTSGIECRMARITFIEALHLNSLIINTKNVAVGTVIARR